MVVESLKDSYSVVRQAALECLSGLGAQNMKFLVWPHTCSLLRLIFVAELQQEIRAVIHVVVESQKDSEPGIPAGDPGSDSRARGITEGPIQMFDKLHLSDSLVSDQKEIQAVIPMVVGSLKDFHSYVRQATLKCLSGLRAKVEFQQEIWAVIPMVVELLKDSEFYVRQAALQCLSGLSAQDREIILITILEWGPLDRARAIGGLLSRSKPT
ncbi:hypothetical protein C8J57DRAFT_1228404 [Mycena rebaudengoi]|nr:hypothetical protein C8J57DRAFT_1228404 [Mycena rebaudengoi]